MYATWEPTYWNGPATAADFLNGAHKITNDKNKTNRNRKQQKKNKTLAIQRYITGTKKIGSKKKYMSMQNNHWGDGSTIPVK